MKISRDLRDKEQFIIYGHNSIGKSLAPLAGRDRQAYITLTLSLERSQSGAGI